MTTDSSMSIPIESRLEMTPSARRWRRFVRWSIWLIVVAAVGLGAVTAARSMRTPTPVRYQTEPVQRGSLTVAVTATGAVQSLTEVKVGTELSGIVETVSAKVDTCEIVHRDVPCVGARCRLLKGLSWGRCTRSITSGRSGARTGHLLGTHPAQRLFHC